jgi:hypothetical protein
MISKIENLKSEDIYILTLMANMKINNDSELIPLSESDMKYTTLFINSTLPENKNAEFKVDDIIDDLMFDVYGQYIFIKKILREAYTLKHNIESNDNMELAEKFVSLYENIIFNSKFEYANIRSIQKQIIQEKIQFYIKYENYEKCATLSKTLEYI